MSNQHNQNEFDKVIQEVERLDEEGHLEEEIFTICDVYGLHADDDRDEILFFIAENLFENGSITI